jgi:uncharacterized protein (DUF1015 family)
MADVRAFRGFRYDLGKVGALGAVVAPPYDVIDPALQQKLYDRSEFNAVRLELTRDDPAARVDKYTVATRTLNGWLNDDTLRQDTARTLYVYEQEFTDADGQARTRRGFLARVRLQPFGQGDVYPHEQTLAGPKADRLKLYQATGFNISPCFGLYPDPAREIDALLDAQVKNSPPLTATDDLGVVNRLWLVTDAVTISKVIGLMGSKPVYIADGHHRYETGLKYLDEQRALGNVHDDETAANFCLMMLVGMGDPGLDIQPTHRLVSGVPAWTAAELQALLAPHFAVAGEFGTDGTACWEHLQMDGSQDVLGFATAADGQYFAAKLADPDVMETLALERSAAWRGLAVSVLHRVVLDKLFAAHGTPECRYVHRLDEVTAALDPAACPVACLVPAVGMAHVEAVAGGGETMPPKSTYFYPKVLTGLVLHSLKKE